MTNHIDRKELKTPDMFQAKGAATLSFVEKNKSILFIFLAAIVAIATGSVIYRNAQDAANEKAASEFYPIKKNFDDAYKKLTDKDKTEANVLETKLKKETDAVIEFSKKVTAKPVAFDAFLTLGNAYYDSKKFEEATTYFDKAIAIAPSKETEYVALYSKAYAFEGMGKTGDAIALFSKVSAADINKGLKSDAELALKRLKTAK